jgi:hypothetical protein
MKEKLEKQAEFGIDLNELHPLRKFMKVFNTYINRCIEMPEIITSLLDMPIMEHSDIALKVNLHKHL